MKTTAQISRETGINKRDILVTANKLGIKGVKATDKPDLYFTVDQELYIHRVLFYELKIDSIILESKLNKHD